MWIKVEDALPIQDYPVKVKNGKVILYAKYYRKKWYWWDRKLHNVTEWFKCPVTYPKMTPSEWRAFFKRVEKYKHQMEKKNFTHGPIIGLSPLSIPNPQSAESFEEEMKNGMD